MRLTSSADVTTKRSLPSDGPDGVDCVDANTEVSLQDGLVRVVAEDSMDQECTQPMWDDTEDQEDDLLSVDAADERSGQQNRADQPKPWGTLIAGETEIPLEHLQMDDDGSCNQYLFGRTKKNVELDERRMRYIEVPNAMVSARHCLLYCVSQGAGQQMAVFVKCLGTNGIIIKQCSSGEEVQIKQLQTPHYRLHTGDCISLVKDKNKKDGVCSTFYFVDKQPTTPSVAMPPPPGMRSRSSTMSGGSSQGVGNSARRFEDAYTKEEEINEGTCGKVYKAIERRTGKEWAVKIINLKRRGTREQTNSIEDLLREADMMRDMSHDNIIRLQEVFQTPEQLLFVMELVKDGDLLDRILKHGKFDEATARDFMRQLLSAVSYLHERNIVHRDLKPENILLEIRGGRMQVKITDFGLAKRTTNEGLRTFCGTPAYFAPEVLLRRWGTVQGFGRYGPEADMWSVGVVLYVILTGRNPFNDQEKMFHQIANASGLDLEEPDWEPVSVAAKHLVRSLLARDPDHRLKAYEAVKHPWLTTDGPVAASALPALREDTVRHQSSSRPRGRSVASSSANSASTSAASSSRGSKRSAASDRPKDGSRLKPALPFHQRFGGPGSNRGRLSQNSHTSHREAGRLAQGQQQKGRGGGAPSRPCGVGTKRKLAAPAGNSATSSFISGTAASSITSAGLSPPPPPPPPPPHLPLPPPGASAGGACATASSSVSSSSASTAAPTSSSSNRAQSKKALKFVAASDNGNDEDDIDEYSSDDDDRGSRRILHIDAKGHRSSVDSAGLASPPKPKKVKARSPPPPKALEPRNIAEVSVAEPRAALRSVANQHSAVANAMKNAEAKSLPPAASLPLSSSSSSSSSSTSSNNVNDVLMRNCKALKSSQSSQPTPDKVSSKKDVVGSNQEVFRGQKPISNFFGKAKK